MNNQNDIAYQIEGITFETPKAPEPVQLSDNALLLAQLTAMQNDSNHNSELSHYQTNHILHFILSIITVGTWLIIWFICDASNVSSRNTIHLKYKKPTERNTAGVVLLGVLVLFVWAFISASH